VRAVESQQSQQGFLCGGFLSSSLHKMDLGLHISGHENCSFATSISSKGDGDMDSLLSLKNEEEEDGDHQQELDACRATLESKQKQLARLQQQHCSNANHLIVLQNRLRATEIQSQARSEHHALVLAELRDQKETLTKSMAEREQLLAAAERSLKEREARIEIWEVERANGNGSRDAVVGGQPSSLTFPLSGDNVVANTMPLSQGKGEIRKYQLRQKIHAQYTAKALNSFHRTLNMVTQKNGTQVAALFKNDEESGKVPQQRRWKSQWQHLIEGVSLDMDIQLSNLERMIKEVAEKGLEYKLLSSWNEEEQHGDSGAGGINDGDGDDNKCGPASQPQHHSQLLLLSRECADLLEDLVRTISKTMETTMRTLPDSLSIEFPHLTAVALSQGNTNGDDAQDNIPTSTTIVNKPAEGQQDDNIDRKPAQTREGREMPYFKQLQLGRLRRAEQQADARLTLLRNDLHIQRAGMQQEQRAHYEIMSGLHVLVRQIAKRLEDCDAEVDTLIQELERRVKEREGEN